MQAKQDLDWDGSTHSCLENFYFTFSFFSPKYPSLNLRSLSSCFFKWEVSNETTTPSGIFTIFASLKNQTKTKSSFSSHSNSFFSSNFSACFRVSVVKHPRHRARLFNWAANRNTASSLGMGFPQQDCPLTPEHTYSGTQFWHNSAVIGSLPCLHARPHRTPLE